MDIQNTILSLQTSMMDKYLSISADRNPTVIGYENCDYDKKLYIISQYSLFSRYIVNFLIEVLYMTSSPEYLEVSEEVKKNITEELGASECGYVPHYTLLCIGFKSALGVDIYGVQPSRATQTFKESVLKSIKSNNAAYATGTAYALESSAVPELKLTEKMTYDIFTDKNINPPMEVLRFFNSHINDIEIQHEDRLKNACIKTINENQIIHFERGFHDLMTTMDNWWTDLASEIN